MALLWALISVSVANAGKIRLVGGEIDTSIASSDDVAGLRASESKDAANAKIPAHTMIVQFEGPIRPEWIEQCERSGIDLSVYLPNFAYLVKGEPPAIATLKKMKGVEWVGPLPPRLKAHPSLRGRPAGEVAITVLSLDETAAKKLSALGYKVDSTRRTRMGWTDIRLKVPVSEIDAISQIPGTFHIEEQPDYIMHGERSAQTVSGNYTPGAAAPTGPGYDTWLAANGLTGGPGLVIQVQDDGLDRGDASNMAGTAHADILGRIAGIFNATSDASGESAAGHGQINAGIILGNATVGTMDGDGYLLGQGMAPQARVYATKIFRNSGAFNLGGNTFSGLARNAQDAGARYSSNSWGADAFGAYTADSALFDALTRDSDSVEAGNQPMTYFFSAGNSGPFASSLGSPASAKNVIAVGAGENSDADGTDGCGVSPTGADSLQDVVNFSSRGPSQDGRFGVTVVAPGTHVQGPVSTAAGYTGNGVCDQFWPIFQTDYARSSGTSHSCPAVAGAALVIDEFLADRDLLDGMNPSPALMRAILTNTATDLVGGNNGNGGTLGNVPDLSQGWGAVNLSTLIDMEEGLTIFDQLDLLNGSGDSFDVLIQTIDTNLPLKITLAWTDVPGTPLAESSIVNDLDLSVSQDATTYLGNNLTSGFSLAGGAENRTETLEAVYIENPSGNYLLRVNAFNIAGDGVPGVGSALDQDFALFVWNGTDQTSAGIIHVQPARVNCAGSIEVQVSDSDLKTTGTITVEVTSASGDTEALILTETDADTGRLIGTLDVTTGAPASDGMLQVDDGDTVTVTYTDLDNGEGMMAMMTDQAVADCSPPQITNITVTGEDRNGFTVNFETNESAAGRIVGGLNCGDSTIDVEGDDGTTHSIRIEGLTDCTQYFFEVRATDLAGNATIENNAAACFPVTTLDFTESFTDDFEPGSEPGWSHSSTIGADNWAVRLSGDARSPTRVYSYVPGPGSTADARLVTPEFTSGGLLSFWHTFGIEDSFDGAVLEITTDMGMNWADLGPFMTRGGYNGTISTLFESPIAGREAWTGESITTMTEVVVDLSTMPGTAQVRFRYAADESVSSQGWLIDDVQIGDLRVCASDTGIVQFQKELFACGDLVEITLFDTNAPAMPIAVVLRSTTGDEETVMVTDGNMDQEYEGSINLGASGDPVMMNDGVLQAADSDAFEVEYMDAAAVGGMPAVATDSAMMDCIAPVISNVTVGELTGLTAQIALDTNESCDVEIRYGLDCTSLTLTRATVVPDVLHAIDIDDLTPETTYYFEVEATDAAGNQTVDDNGSNCFTFTTPFQTDYFTESFGEGDNDLGNQTLIFTPDDTPSSYSVCSLEATEFPTSTAGATTIALGDDDFERIDLTGGAKVPFYGTEYGSIFVGSNGYLTFGTGDSEFFDSTEDHFSLPRISGLFDDLNPGSDGTVSWQQLPDRVVITYEDVPQFFGSDANSFQIEIFLTGVIRLTHLTIEAPDGVVGLSQGSGEQNDFFESDLNRYSDCVDDDPLTTISATKFTQTAQSWIGGSFGGLQGFGGSTAQMAGEGLCMSVGASGINGVQWKSPNNLFAIAARTIYRVRTFLTTDQTTQGSVPVWDFNYINAQPSGFLNFGGRRFFIDTEGGANGIGQTDGRNFFDVFIAPAPLDTPQWNGDGALSTSDHAFTTEASALTGIRFVYRVLDFEAGLQAATRSGTICVGQIEIDSIPLADIDDAATTVYSAPITTGTHRAFRPSTAIDPGITTSLDAGAKTLSYTFPSAANAQVDPLVATFGPDIAALPLFVEDPSPDIGMVRNPLKLYPSTWESNTLYRARVAISALASEANPIDVIGLTHDAYTLEIGGEDFIASGDEGVTGGMAGAGSPKLRSTTDPITGGAVPEWHTYFYGNSVTESLVTDSNRWRAQIDFFNRTDIGIRDPKDQTGTDTFVIHGLEFDRIDLDLF